MRWTDHILIVPIVLPLIAGAAMLLIKESKRRLKAAIGLGSIVLTTAVAVILLYLADTSAQPLVYRLGGWPTPFAIVLVADRLSAIMVLLTAVLALTSYVFSLSRWHRAGSHFHSLFQFLLMGLNGAFLTGDLFNLFVFFELLLAASYALVLHGSGIQRVRAGMHYIAINLAASLLFLIGVSLIYSVTGTLNMADLAVRVPQLSADSRSLLETGAAVLGVAFFVKAGIWPLCFWLPTTYAAAAPPIAAMFAIMSKVGIYVILRLWLLLFGEGSGVSAHFGSEWLLIGGIATIIFGVIGALASQDMPRLASYSVLISSGTVLAAIATGDANVTGGALFYLVSSTMAIGAFFMLIELLERGRDPFADMLAVTREAYGEDEEEEEDEIGVAIPATVAILGMCFLGCALVLAGLPPLSGFIAKFAILTALLNPAGSDAAISIVAWILLALLMVSGLMTLIAMTRAGIRTLWMTHERVVPRVGVIEIVPIALLLLFSVTLTVRAEPAMRYMRATASAIHTPTDYVRSVLSPTAQQPAVKAGERP